MLNSNRLRLGRQRLLTALNRLISASLDMDDVLKAIAQAAATLMGASVASFWIVDEETQTLELRAFSNEMMGEDQTFRRARFGEGSAGWVAANRVPMHADDAFTDGRVGGLDWYREHGLKSTYTAPVMADEQLLAVLSLNGRQPFRFNDYDRSLLDGLVAQAAAAIRNARLYATVASALQAARAADRAKSDFLAMMSHEIRTPLNGILGCAELLQGTGLTADQADLATTITTSGEMLLAIVNDVLDFARVESGRLELEAIPFEPVRVIRGVMQMVRPAALAKQLRLRVDVPPELPQTVIGDPGRLSQVLVNLLGNAVKFTAAGEVSVRIRCDRAADGFRLTVAVQDTGIGMSPAVQATLFQPFVQADSSTTRRYGGTGLGLAISKRLVELMGGEIGVESVPEQGSTFTFTVPVRLPDPGYPVPAGGPLPEDEPADARVHGTVERDTGVQDTWAPALPPGAEQTRRRVLLVEDNDLNRRIVILMAERLGYEVEAVTNGQHAIAALKSGVGFDLILMDCHLPEEDGFEVTRRIQQLDGAASLTPIVALTANAHASDRQRCLDAGMVDFMAKPVTFQVFAQTLRRWLGC